jgi:2-polyprenyl-3-methyl-5-hydroxy-6-metoxy-1,4-benzoquinol methylase
MMRAPQVDAIEMHSQDADGFDAQYRTSRDFRQRHRVWTALIRKHASPNGRVIDVGCGSGVFSLIAAEQSESVLGIDGSAEMVALCNRKLSKSKLCNVAFIQAKIEDLLHLGLGKADLVLCSSVLEYVDDLRGCLEILVGLLGFGGKLIVSMPNRRSLYRRLEHVTFRLIGKPAYLACVRHLSTVADFNALASGCELKSIEAEYYGTFLPVAPPEPSSTWSPLINNMFVGVYQIRERF